MIDIILKFLFCERRAILIITAIFAFAGSILNANAETIRGVQILSVHTGKCLSVKDGQAASGAPIEEKSCESASSQLFNFVRLADGNFRIRPQANTANCIDLNAPLGVNGVQLIQKTCGSSPARRQKFRLVELEEGSFQMQTMDDRCVDIAEGSAADGTAVITWTCHGQPWQQFWLVGFSTSPPNPTNPAQAFMRNLRLGINIERFAATSWGVGDFASGTEGYTYLKNLGITHVRLFYPWRPSVHMGGSDGVDIAPRPEQFANILPAVHNAIRAGLKVFLDLTDVMGPEDFAGGRQQLVENYLAMAAARIAAENFNPAMLAVGAVNEWATWDPNIPTWRSGYNPIFNAQRQQVLTILRRFLPTFTLTTGPAVWKHYEQLLQSDFQVSSDTNIIYEVHAYDWNASDAQHWSNVANRLKAWSAAHGNAPVHFGEAGFGFDNALPGNEGAWVNALHAMTPHLMPFAPSFWAITSGRDWRMNLAPDSYPLKNELATAIRSYQSTNSR